MDPDCYFWLDPDQVTINTDPKHWLYHLYNMHHFLIRSGLPEPVMFDLSGSGQISASAQSWEFAHLISERIARFLPKNEQMRDLLKKMSDSLIPSFL